jgi:hypothetical protein
MSEVPQESGWTGEACQEFLDDYTARLEQAKEEDRFYYFMRAHDGTFPREVVEYKLKKGIAVALPAGEMARLFPGSEPVRLPGVEVVSINDTDR